jgi:aerobic carbon-monoxide dehydrogenase medium subunit
MIPRFSLARPTTLADALAAHAAADGEGAYVAGGTELLQVMKMGLAQFATLIDLKRVAELHGIGVEDDGTLRIGGGVTHREIERSEVVARELPVLVELERHLANVRVRNQGTIGGNLAFAEPHSDPATLLLACDGRIELAGSAGRRLLAVDAFVLGPLDTSREPDDILVSILVPAAGPGVGRGYAKAKFFERPAVSVAVQLQVTAGLVTQARVAVGSITEIPQLVPSAADGLIGAEATEASVATRARAVAPSAFATLDAVDDLNGAADYKRHLAGVLLEQAALAALREATAHA